MSRKAVDWAYSLGNVKLPTGLRLTLLYLADRHNGRTGQCFPSYDRIAEDLGVDRNTAIRHIKLLENKWRLLRKKERRDQRQRSNQYDLAIGYHPLQGDNPATLNKSSQGDKNYTLADEPQGDISPPSRVTLVSPEHKEQGTSRITQATRRLAAAGLIEVEDRPVTFQLSDERTWRSD